MAAYACFNLSLPAFVGAMTARWYHLRDLLNSAADAEPDQALTVGAKNYRRLFTVGDARHSERRGHANIRVLDESTGRKLNVTFTEDAAFWQWATVETLRHTGLRCEASGAIPVEHPPSFIEQLS